VTSNKGLNTSEFEGEGVEGRDVKKGTIEIDWLPTPNDVLEGVNRTVLLVDIVQPGDLNQPTNVVREQLVVDDPLREFVPLVIFTTVDTNAPFAILWATSVARPHLARK
jgi:hypothetical protein